MVRKFLGLIILVAILFSSWVAFQPDFGSEINSIRTDFANHLNTINSERAVWIQLIDDLYQTSEHDLPASIRIIDSLLENKSDLNGREIGDLYYTKGDIYQSADSLKHALEAFNYALQGGNVPTYLVARADVFIRQSLMDNAYLDLKKAAEINYSFHWQLGNFFEIQGNIDSAIDHYQMLYEKDTIFYKYCHARIAQLKQPNTELIQKLETKLQPNYEVYLEPNF